MRAGMLGSGGVLVMESETAKVLLKELLACSGKLDRTVALARGICGDDEYRQYRLRVGHILAEITLTLRLLEELCPGLDPWNQVGDDT